MSQRLFLLTKTHLIVMPIILIVLTLKFSIQKLEKRLTYMPVSFRMTILVVKRSVSVAMAVSIMTIVTYMSTVMSVLSTMTE